MRKFIFQEKGSLFIITLNVIIILSIFLFSFSFNALTRYKLLSGEIKQYQACLNAKSGIVLALKELGAKPAIPFKKTFPLFNDADYQAEVSLDYVTFEKNENKAEIRPAKTSDIIRITSTGKYKDTGWKIIILKKGNRQLFYYSQ
jgi:hypothetical protein